MERKPLFTADATVTAGRNRRSEAADNTVRDHLAVPCAHAMQGNVDVALTVNGSLEKVYGN